MSDLIDRKDAIEAIKSLHIESGEYHEYNHGLYEARTILDHVPSAKGCEYLDSESDFCSLHRPSAEKTGRWIPVSERLPGEDTEVLITDEKGRIRVAEYGAGGWEINDVEECVWQYLHDDPIAWQPLPKPYKGQANCGERMVD